MNIEKSDLAFDFEAHREASLAIYREKRGLYEDFCQTITRILGDVLKTAGISVHSIEARAKTFDSFAGKVSKPSPLHPQQPKYSDPLKQITDLAAVRVITFLPNAVTQVCLSIDSEFAVIEKTDKAEELMDEGKFGYQSIHFLVQLGSSRSQLPEYRRFAGLVAEIQVRTILQHAWAAMEHDIQYKSASVIPALIRRRFIALAGMLEIADREFQALQEQDLNIRIQARNSVKSGKLSEVEVTPDSLKAYLDNKLGPDGRQNSLSYEISAKLVKELGFTTLQQIDDCLKGYDSAAISRIFWETKQGQITRFEDALLASMGKRFVERHPWAKEPFWIERFPEKIELLEAHGVVVGSYDPREAS